MNEAAQKPREGSQQFPLTDAIQQEAKAYHYRRAPVLPFWPVWGWEKKQTFKVPSPSHLNTGAGSQLSPEGLCFPGIPTLSFSTMQTLYSRLQ